MVELVNSFIVGNTTLVEILDLSRFISTRYKSEFQVQQNCTDP